MADIIVTKSNGTSDVTYKLQQNQGSLKVYGNESAGLTTPETLRVQHFLRPAGSRGTDRHQIVFSKAIVESTTGQYMVLSASLQLNIPRSTEVTLAMTKDIMAQMTSYANLTANVTSLFNGATPEGDYNVTGPFNPSIV
jgi:hypothetical protein